MVLVTLLANLLPQIAVYLSVPLEPQAWKLTLHLTFLRQGLSLARSLPSRLDQWSRQAPGSACLLLLGALLFKNVSLEDLTLGLVLAK